MAEMYSHLAGDLDGDQRIQELPQSQREEPQWLERAGETPDPGIDGRMETGWSAIDEVSVRGREPRCPGTTHGEQFTSNVVQVKKSTRLLKISALAGIHLGCVAVVFTL